MPIQPNQLKAAVNADNIQSKASLEKILEEQKEILLKIYENSQKTRRYILFGRVLSIVYLILIAAPIIFAIIYLPPLLERTIAPYQELMGIDPGKNGIDFETVSNILKQIK